MSAPEKALDTRLAPPRGGSTVSRSLGGKVIGLLMRALNVCQLQICDPDQRQELLASQPSARQIRQALAAANLDQACAVMDRRSAGPPCSHDGKDEAKFRPYPIRPASIDLRYQDGIGHGVTGVVLMALTLWQLNGGVLHLVVSHLLQ